MRAAAAEMVQGLSGSDEGVAQARCVCLSAAAGVRALTRSRVALLQLAERSADMVPPLLRLLGARAAACCVCACAALLTRCRCAEAAGRGALRRHGAREPDGGRARG